MNKQELRSLFLAKRLLLTDLELQQKTILLTDKILAKVKEVNPKLVLLFLPIENKNEFDCKPLAKSLWNLGIKTALPIADFGTKNIRFADYFPNAKITEKKYGILEPEHPKFILDYSGALCVVPLLVHDKNGFRVGYGGGFYDRFFAQYPNIYKLGISFFSPVDFIDDLDEFDVSLDGIFFSQA